MKTVDIHRAKTHLSRLCEHASEGEPLIIAQDGNPLLKVTSLGASKTGTARRTGFMAGQAWSIDSEKRTRFSESMLKSLDQHRIRSEKWVHFSVRRCRVPADCDRLGHGAIEGSFDGVP